MRKLQILIASMAIVLMTTSGFNTGENGVSEGKPAPINELTNILGKETITNHGQDILLNLWSASDGESRARAKEYQTHINTKKTHLININLSDNPCLYNSIVKLDGIDKQTSIYINEETTSKIREILGMGDATGAILISADGMVKAINPEASTL